MGKLNFYALNTILVPADLFLHFLNRRYRLFKWFILHVPSGIFEVWGRLNLQRAFLHAKIFVPAYKQFLQQASADDWFDALAAPEIDKDNYIRKFDTVSRTVGGRIPFQDTLVDESSGSSGTPYNWIRTLEERQVSHKLVSHFARYGLGKEELFTINAFSMGSWATGLNMGLALQNNGLVKNVGPDVDKVLSTMEFWGTDYDYVICGYPPFLKHILDVAREREFQLDKYSLNALVGGEGMSEGLRDYLLTTFEQVFSGYGATDLEIGVAGETPVSIEIRRAARTNKDLRYALFGDDSRLPMLFQFNPVSHYIQANDAGEIIVSITRLNVLSPRIRYNIHDEGGVMSFAAMVKACLDRAPDLRSTMLKKERVPKLPFMWIYGRKDYTVSVMGANIYPEDIEQCLYADAKLATITRSYCLGLLESDGNVRPEFSFEIDDEITPELASRFETSIIQHLLSMNSDFREAWHEYRESVAPKISLHRIGRGPFRNDTGRIKQVRMVT